MMLDALSEPAAGLPLSALSMVEREVLATCETPCILSVGCSEVIGEEGGCAPMLGEELNAAVESLRFPTRAAVVTVEAEVLMEGERRIRNRCGSSAEASMLMSRSSIRDLSRCETARS